MSAAGMVGNFETKEIPPYVRFSRMEIEDKAESLAQGKFVAKHIDYAHITAVGSKDSIPLKVTQWFSNLEQDKSFGRIPPEWVERFHKHYDAWKLGQELPVEGTPILSWGVISPLQRENLISLHIRTVEDLASCNDEARRRLGMGAMDLQNKARAWLQQLQSAGPNVQKIAALETENRVLKESLESALTRLQAIEQRMGAGETLGPASAGVSSEDISADDILPEMEPAAARPRKK